MKGSGYVGQRCELSKELENINFRNLQENLVDNGDKERSAKHWISNDTKPDDTDKNKTPDQFTSFQKAMRLVILWGQCMGLNPVSGILQMDVSKMRFTIRSVKFLFAIMMAIAQTIGTMLCLYKLFKNPNNIKSLGFVTFYTTACLTTVSFIRVAPKWPTLVKEIINSKLDVYIHPKIIQRCKVACAVFMTMGMMEHIMAILAKLARILECNEGMGDVGEAFMKINSPWLYDLNVPYMKWSGAIVLYLNVVATAAWNYADIFIVCISLYLTSIMEQINKKIVLTATKNYVPATTWAALREDYTRATYLVKMFDEVFSGLVLVSFANDLFFICLQFYNVLANGIKSAHHVNSLCPGHENSVFHIYIFPAYLIYSTVYLCFRFLTVALVASGVNTSSFFPLPVLYTVPSTSYNKEVERFQNQIKGDTVAFSGLNFFYITRDLVLAVAGTIVTYELVLLQFSNDDK